MKSCSLYLTLCVYVCVCVCVWEWVGLVEGCLEKGGVDEGGREGGHWGKIENSCDLFFHPSFQSWSSLSLLQSSTSSLLCSAKPASHCGELDTVGTES